MNANFPFWDGAHVAAGYMDCREVKELPCFFFLKNGADVQVGVYFRGI